MSIHRVKVFVGSCFALLVAISSSASADDLVSGTRSERLYERRHDVVASLHRGWVELRVRRTVENLGPRHDQAMIWISTPPNAVATRLRTLGESAGRPTWFSAELMESEAAAAKYRELTGIGGYYPKDPALLSWRSESQLLLQVFPVAPSTEKTVEYSLIAPTVYEHGAHRYTLSGVGTSDLSADVSLASAPRGERLLLSNENATGGARRRLLVGKELELGLVPKSDGPWAGELGVAPTGKRFVTHFSVEASPKVSKVPRNAFLVVALDASRSLGSGAIEAEKRAALAYLAHFRDAKVEVLLFDRKVRPRYGTFVPVERVRRDLLALPIEQRNGSALELALSEAETRLASAPNGAKRSVVISDGLTRSGLKPPRVAAALSDAKGIAHLGLIAEGTPSLARDDEHALAPALRSTGGLVWRAHASSHASDAVAMKRVYEEWARPTRIDHIKLFSADLELGTDVARPDSLPEGEGLSFLGFSPRDVAWVRVEGELWSKPTEHVFHADASAAQRWAALVFGSALAAELSESEMMKLALAGRAVSPVTSYLAVEPGVRPSTEGFAWGHVGSGFGSGRAPSVRMGMSSVSGRTRTLDREKWLRDQLVPAWDACGGKPDTANVAFETTFAEVVDVTHVELEPPDPLLQRCLSDAVWDLVLPPQFDEAWMVFRVEL